MRRLHPAETYARKRLRRATLQRSPGLDLSRRLDLDMKRPSVLACSYLCCLFLLALAAPARAAEPVDYLKQVKPLLVARCYKCHGPDEQESGLRLDSLAAAREGGNSGPAVVPGKSAQSRMFQAISGSDEVSLMPPEDEGPRLKAAEIALIKTWIDQGAIAPADEAVAAAVKKNADHWAFQPVVVHAPPAVKQQAWVRNPIDQYILGKLAEKQIAPSAEADRPTLIRRLSFDLLGLPPTPAEVDAFVSDKSDRAYDNLVERLLNSPHYGERWGRHWLDAARYADSNGYTIDGSRSIWKYRDWVINAINNDLPFDEFTVLQLAGDMLPEATSDQIIATGFHRNTLKNEEGGTDQEQFRIDAVADRVETTGSVFLGLTVGCARCHDHKYDPVSQREFYQLFAVFNNADEPSLSLPTNKQSKELPALQAELTLGVKRQKDVEDTANARSKEWEKRLEGKLDFQWTVLDPVEFKSDSGLTLTKLDDKSLKTSGKTPATAVYTIVADAPMEAVTAIKVEALLDDDLPKGPGLYAGVFTISEFSIKAKPADEPAGKASEPEMPVVLGNAVTADETEKSPLEYAIDGDEKTGWTVLPNKTGPAKNVTAIFVPKDDIGPLKPARMTFRISQSSKKGGEIIGRLRLSVATADREAVVVSDAGLEVLKVAPEKRTDEQKKIVQDEFRKVDEELAAIVAQVKLLKQREKQLSQSVTTTLVMKERATPRETRIHVRGDFLRLGALVKPDVPAVLPPLEPAGKVANRLDFAKWLVDERNPLTPRVTVNRSWQEFFGRGIVETENDFGLQGSRPTHPELLDYLAAEFMAGKWSMKSLHRLIVTSATYRQSSNARTDLREKDPDNKLLARQSRLRLTAETVRDVSLAAAGLLTDEVGGPGVYPPQPEGVYRFTQVAKFWAESPGTDRYRRGIYTYFWRSRPYPFLSTFDAPDGNVTCTRRLRSNTPLQALTLANDRAFFEAAQGLAARVLKEGTASDGDRVRRAFRICFAREANDTEAQRLVEFFDVQRLHYEATPDAAKLIAPKSLPKDTSEAVAAAWTATARVMMNLDEFITRE